ncbi:MAG: benzoyl-CoA reductase subunit D [Oligoflexia bacterium]|nr:benzoyl-CoA reductase subunit D [Oligoflexia bacterium]
MTITAGIDVGSGAVKAVVMDCSPDQPQLLAHATSRIRRRAVSNVVDEVVGRVLADADVDQIHYVATTGEGEEIPFATGHFYGMTTHARGALFLAPAARTVLDVGALHSRAVAMDGRGKVLDYKMTSQCASGSGQFLENIARYLGVSLAEVGPLSASAEKPEGVSSICAVLAETDVINMVSRGIDTCDILRGIHDSMAGRFARLLRSLKAEGTVFMSGGLAGDIGLQKALQEALDGDRRRKGGPITLVVDPLSIYAGAMGAAIWGAFRYHRLGSRGAAWTSTEAAPTYASAR